MGAIEALANALKGFSGGVLVISHDQVLPTVQHYAARVDTVGYSELFLITPAIVCSPLSLHGFDGD
jgi:hypothetical protein